MALSVESSALQGLLAVLEGGHCWVSPVGHGFRLVVNMHRTMVTPIVGQKAINNFELT